MLGTGLRVHAREAMVKWSMNVMLKSGELAMDALRMDLAYLLKIMADAMRIGRRLVETMEKESARLHSERLPNLREAERMFHVREERKASVMRAFVQMRAEGREVRRVGAIALLTAPQVTKQIALRVFLDKVQVERRTGKKEEMVAVLTGLVQREVAARAHMTGDGKEEITSDSETTRLHSRTWLREEEEEEAHCTGGAHRRPAPRTRPACTATTPRPTRATRPAPRPRRR